MDIRWNDLADVVVASLGVTIAVVVMFSLGIVAWARAGGGGGRRPPTADRRTGRQRLAAGVALLCFAACLAVAAYGIDVIVPG